MPQTVAVDAVECFACEALRASGASDKQAGLVAH